MTAIKLFVVFALSLGIAMGSLFTADAQKPPARPRLAAFRGNNCVGCHAAITDPLHMSAHFFEWLGSSHEKAGIGCEQCHGGDPASAIAATAHKGVQRAVFPQSTLSPRNLPETCSKCHAQLVHAFTQSQHFQILWDKDGAPSCTTCHQHMATAVISWPPQTAALCAACHKDKTNRASQYDTVPDEARDSIAALSRADEVIEWSYYLISEGRKKRMKFPAEIERLKALQASLKEARTLWHSFNVKATRQKADQVFLEATNVKNSLAAKGL